MPPAAAPSGPKMIEVRESQAFCLQSVIPVNRHVLRRTTTQASDVSVVIADGFGAAARRIFYDNSRAPGKGCTPIIGAMSLIRLTGALDTYRHAFDNTCWVAAKVHGDALENARFTHPAYEPSA